MTSPRPIASVIIPAHNEERVLARCLAGLLEGARPGEFEVVVAANGCQDNTVGIARKFNSFGVSVVETQTASKIVALNLGDETATTFPRIYLDADAVIDAETGRALVSAVGEPGGPLAAAPVLNLDTSHASRSARAYLLVWQSLPIFQRSYVGSGCFALSADGRARFAVFPDVLGDDRFVNALFAEEEKRTLAGHQLRVQGPRTLRGIIRRSLRVRSGTLSLNTVMAAEGYAIADSGRGRATGPYLLQLLGDRQRRSAAVLFLAVSVYIRAASRIRSAAGKGSVWLRDDTSRT